VGDHQRGTIAAEFTKKFFANKNAEIYSFFRTGGGPVRNVSRSPQRRSVEQFYDNSIVQELIGEGFFVSLWGKNL